MKPNDVSDRAWWFACNEIERAEPYRQHLTGEVYMTSEEVLPMLRVALARSFDKALTGYDPSKLAALLAACEALKNEEDMTKAHSIAVGLIGHYIALKGEE